MPTSDRHLSLAAAQLLEHYARCGVRMLPRGADASVRDWFQSNAAAFPAEPATLEQAVSLEQAAAGEAQAKVQIERRVEKLIDATPPSVLAPPPPSPAAANGLELNVGGGRWERETLSEERRLTVLAAEAETVAGCTRCPELVCSRTRTVYGIGSPRPPLVFIGEGPGAEEDRRGEPFVGAAGELLNKIIAAMKLRREDVYIMNAVKCRPQNNRTPSDQEIANCHDYFETQLETLQPRFIICLGVVAARALLQTTSTVGRLRSRFHRYRGAQVVVTYHPAYLLRTPEAKRATWEDVQMVMAAMAKQ